MKIERRNHIPEPPTPPEFVLTFDRNEGWMILAALHEYAGRHPDAANVKSWRSWANDLDKVLRA